MKKCLYLFIFIFLLSLYACNDDLKVGDYTTYRVALQLVYPDSIATETDTIKHATRKGVKVELLSTASQKYEAVTNDDGLAIFEIPGGKYSAVVSESRAMVGFINLFNGNAANIGMDREVSENEPLEVKLEKSIKGQVIIKELYVGGCQKEDGAVYQYDKYVVLYNNSDLMATFSPKTLCLGMATPANSHGTNNDYVDGNLVYANDNWMPAGNGIWYYPDSLEIKPGAEIVIALNKAVDNTVTYSNSINFSNPAYYCTYDILHYPNAAMYGVPDPVIPIKNYWSAYRYGLGNAWALSTLSPAFFIFRTGPYNSGEEPIDAIEFATSEKYDNYYGNNQTATNKRKKVPIDWILDGVEVYTTTSDKNQKRFTPKIDVGYTYLENKFGYTSYRNVDVEATLAIEGNADKLVYGYDKGTMVGATKSIDPSGIDAEASIKKGARIIYMDTNNSTADFHQRSRASLRDK